MQPEWTFYDKIHASLQRLSEYQQQLIDEDVEDDLIRVNQTLILEIDEFLVSIKAHISNLTTDVQKTEISKLESNKLLETNQRLNEVFDKISQSPQSNYEKLATVLDRILTKEDGSTEIKSRSQLPKLYIKKFYSDLLEWPSFLDSFQAAISSHPLSNAEKLNYLKSLLGGQAQADIQGLPVLDTSYLKAIDTLQELYSNKSLIVSSASKKIGHIKQSDCNPQHLQNAPTKFLK